MRDALQLRGWLCGYITSLIVKVEVKVAVTMFCFYSYCSRIIRWIRIPLCDCLK